MLESFTSTYLIIKGLKMNKKINKLIKISDVMKQTSLSRSSIYRLVNQGLFPEQVKLSTRSSAWIESEIDDWIKEKSRERFNNASFNSIRKNPEVKNEK